MTLQRQHDAKVKEAIAGVRADIRTKLEAQIKVFLEGATIGGQFTNIRTSYDWRSHKMNVTFDYVPTGPDDPVLPLISK